MNWDLIFLVVFGLVLLLIMLLNKKRTKLQKILFPLFYFVLYRTKIGLGFMDKLAKKYPKTLRVLSKISVGVGFLGMFLILYFLLTGAYGFLFMEQPSPLQLLLPGQEPVPGLPKLSFFHWIIAIFILAIVHEFSHGVFARLRNLKVKSSGFAIFGIVLPIIPAAFVEPDEKQLLKAKKSTQLEVFSAGSFANIITAFVFFILLTFLISPIAAQTIDNTGVRAWNFEPGYPANLSGMKPGEDIISVNNIDVNNVSDFVKVMKDVKPGDEVSIVTENNTYYNMIAKENPENSSKGHIGIYIEASKQEFNKLYKERYGEFLLKVLFWIQILFFWVFVANLGVGLFNLLPFGPLDGGRMFLISLLHFTKDEKKSKRIFLWVSLLFLALIVILLIPQFMKLVGNPILNFFR
jgi:membrane-associated protease RseP (regulator of RpoE activity)